MSTPTVTTTAISSIMATSGSSGGNVTSDGGAEVTARGVCWSISADPTTADDKTSDGTGTGSFTSSITGLSPNTTYHVRAYATNSEGTAYGDDVSFTTFENPVISGKVSMSDGSDLEDVTVSFSNGGGEALTDSSGDYSLTVDYDFSGTATPSKAGYAFSPATRSYTNVITNQTSQDYLAVEVVSPEISLSVTLLNFGATTSGVKTPDESFLIFNTGGGVLDWSVTENAGWLTFSEVSVTSIPPTGVSEVITGNGDAVINVSVDPADLIAREEPYTAIITVSSVNASNLAQAINVFLKVSEEGEDSAPFGVFDTPADGLTVSGSIPVTGWALDDIEVTKVVIKRDPDPDDPVAAIGSDGLIYIGDAVFVNGSRTDVEALYQEYPLNDRAGWGYMMLTYGLPRQGNGTFTLYAFADDASGHRVLLGIKQITSDNANRVKPFGSIDTPGQGAVISGNYVTSDGP